MREGEDEGIDGKGMIEWWKSGGMRERLVLTEGKKRA